MGFLDGVAGRLKKFSDGRIEGRVERITRETERIESQFRAEAKKFGIEIYRTASRNYYEILGIRYTNDQKQIRDAYLRLIKRYHPDVSSDVSAKERSEEINEAYGVLKDRSKKLDYDTAFSKGTNRLGAGASRAMSDALLKRYMEMREKEFNEFRERISTPQYKDAIKSAIEDVTDWKKRFKKSESYVFGPILDQARSIRKLGRVNSSILKSKYGSRYYEKLSRNARTLAMLSESASEIEKGIAAVAASTRSKIGEDEEKIARRLRASV